MAYRPTKIDPNNVYPPGFASRVLGIPGGTISTWAGRGWLANFDAAFAQGRGKARLFSLSDVLALAYLKFASTNGFTQPEVVSYAPDAADAYLEFGDHLKEVIFRYYPGKTSIRFNDDIMTEPADPGPELTIAFNIQNIFDKALRAIDDELKSTSIERETTIEEMNPSLPKISRSWQPDDK